MSARILSVLAFALLVACGGDDDGGGSTGGGGGGGGGGGSNGGNGGSSESSSSSSSSSSCSSESTSSQAYVCIGDRCKCASSKEDKYPYTKEEAEKACSSGTSTGNCPPNGG